jgi:2-methylcitrate dehydratase PrpD
MQDGARKTVTIECPRGHYQNPMTDAEVEAKFHQLARRVHPEQRIEQVLRLLWGMEDSPTPEPLFKALCVR